MNTIKPVQAIIVSAIIPPGAETYNGGYAVGTLGYNGMLRVTDGDDRQIQIGRPSNGDAWEDPQFVRPLKPGKTIHGLCVNDVFYWFYTEPAVVDQECGA